MKNLHAKDIEFLNKTSSSRHIFSISLIMIGMASLSLISAMFKLFLTSKIATKNGMNLRTLFTSWIDGFEYQSVYEGWYCYAIEALSTSILYTIVAIILFINLLSFRRTAKRNQRILQYMKSNDL